MGEIPGAADRRRPPPDGAGREQDRRQHAHGEPDPQPAEHPPRDADADRGQGDGDRLLVGGQAEERDERQEHERRQRREREQDLAGGLAVRVEQRVDVLEVPVRRTVGAVGDGPVEGNLAVQERVSLPDEVVVLVVVLGVGPRVQDERRQRQQQPDDDGRGATEAGLRRQKGPVRGPRLYSAPPSTLRERLPVTGLGSGAPGRDSTTDEAPRRGFGWQLLAILAIGARVPPDDGIRVRRAPGIRVPLRPRPVPLLGRQPGQNRVRSASTTADFFADYTPGYLYALWLVGHRRPAAWAASAT